LDRRLKLGMAVAAAAGLSVKLGSAFRALAARDSDTGLLTWRETRGRGCEERERIM
jgi:hypothetical protein